VDVVPLKHYLVVYGSHDGDVAGAGNGAHAFTGCGFRLYDRSNTHRAMVFIHGANHNQFNRAWTTNDAAPLISRAVQEDLAKEYVVGWVRFSVLNDWPQANLFNGTTANAHGTPVSLMWKFGRDLKTIERYQDADPTKNTLTGRVVKPGYVTEVEIDNDNPQDPAQVAGVLLPTFPHVDRVTKAAPVAGTRAPLREEIPAAHQDFHAFTHLTFRVTKLYPTTSQATINAAAFPEFSVTLEDNAGHRKTVPAAAIHAANPRKVKPIFRPPFADEDPAINATRNITKCNLETWKVPLSLFTAAPTPATLTSIKAVEFDFSAAAGQPIYIDTISLVKL